MSAGFTPGPWAYRPDEGDDWGVVRAGPDEQGDSWIICKARAPKVSQRDAAQARHDGSDPYEANARLIAAAPDMLAALQVLTTQRDGHFHTAEAWQAGRDAIAKAEGK